MRAMFASAAVAAAALFLCSAAQAGEWPKIEGAWATSSFGPIDFKVKERKDDKGAVVGLDVSGAYPAQRGKIKGEMQGNKLVGYWFEPSSSVTCSTKREGSSNWGRVEFSFNDDGDMYDGKWGYCDETTERGWSGTRV